MFSDGGFELSLVFRACFVGVLLDRGLGPSVPTVLFPVDVFARFLGAACPAVSSRAALAVVHVKHLQRGEGSCGQGCVG